jgi:hypothetical protein
MVGDKGTVYNGEAGVKDSDTRRKLRCEGSSGDLALRNGPTIECNSSGALVDKVGYCLKDCLLRVMSPWVRNSGPPGGIIRVHLPGSISEDKGTDEGMSARKEDRDRLGNTVSWCWFRDNLNFPSAQPPIQCSFERCALLIYIIRKGA